MAARARRSTLDCILGTFFRLKLPSHANAIVMRRRTVLGLRADASTLGTGCVLNLTPNHPVDLLVHNDTDAERTARVAVGGEMTPVDADPPEGETPTPVGIEVVSVDRTVTLAAGRERRFEEVATTTDGPRCLGITVEVSDDLSLRQPVWVARRAGGTLVEATVRADDIDLSVAEYGAAAGPIPGLAPNDVVTGVASITKSELVKNSPACLGIPGQYGLRFEKSHRIPWEQSRSQHPQSVDPEPVATIPSARI